MSLDVYLYGKQIKSECTCNECGNTHFTNEREKLYTADITGNLFEMAHEAGIGDALWKPDRLKITKAIELIPLLENGLNKLKADPDKFKEFNPSNGWGDYDGLVDFVDRYLGACKRHPEASVDIWR